MCIEFKLLLDYTLCTVYCVSDIVGLFILPGNRSGYIIADLKNHAEKHIADTQQTTPTHTPFFIKY